MNQFIRNLDELLYLASRKASLTDNLKKVKSDYLQFEACVKNLKL